MALESRGRPKESPAEVKEQYTLEYYDVPKLL